MEGSLCLVAAERPQWPRVYLLGRPRPCDRMPSLVGDSGQVLGVLGWVLTRMCNLPLVLQCCRHFNSGCVWNSELFTDIRGRSEASNVC